MPQSELNPTLFITLILNHIPSNTQINLYMIEQTEQSVQVHLTFRDRSGSAGCGMSNDGCNVMLNLHINYTLSASTNDKKLSSATFPVWEEYNRGMYLEHFGKHLCTFNPKVLPVVFNRRYCCLRNTSSLFQILLRPVT